VGEHKPLSLEPGAECPGVLSNSSIVTVPFVLKFVEVEE
jgi:hypothetical protein